MKMTPIYGERALFFSEERAIVVADLHIGIELEYRMQGVNIAMQTENLIDRCMKLLHEHNAEKFIVVGDIKHVIGGKEESEIERREVSKFLREIHEEAEIWIVKGNHDGRLRSKYAKIYGARGILLGDIALLHGHSWGDEEIMRADSLIMGHIHPFVRISTRVGYSYIHPCWVRGKFLKNEFKRRYPEGNENMEFIIMPAFNPLCGGVAVNRERIEGVMGKMMDMENAEIYLLNGLNLGRARNLR